MRNLLPGLCVLCVPVLALQALSAEPANVTVLQAESSWRCRFALAPVIAVRDGAPFLFETNVQCRSTSVATNWFAADFSDGDWSRMCGPFALPASGTGGKAGSSRLSVIYLRSYFNVTDAAEIKDLTLSLAYRGGVAVYLNGEEVARNDLPSGVLTQASLAAEYPLAAYYSTDDCTRGISWGFGDPEKYKDRIALRIRKLEGVSIPSSKLRKGCNVLALEIHRAPLPEKWAKAGSNERNGGDWVQAGLVSLSLNAESQKPSIQAASSLGEFTVWPVGVTDSFADSAVASVAEPIRPLRMLAPANAQASGVLMAGAGQTLTNLKAEATELKGPGVIPAQAVSVRFPKVDGARADALLPQAPAEIPVVKRTGVINGAVQPVWVTVNVPQDAKAGEYNGLLNISAEGMTPVQRHISLKVAPWRAPAPRDAMGFTDLIQSPESVALKYKIPLWSPKHWELLAGAFKQLGRVGSRVAYLHLIGRTNMGNSESMVRWARKSDGSLVPDFTIVEKYLDEWEKGAGKPDVVCLYVWERMAGGGYMGGREEPPKGVTVSVVGPDGVVETYTNAPFGTAEAEAFWKPVLDELHARINKRGITDEHIMLGVGQDTRPSKVVTDFFQKIAPYARWILQTHAGPDDVGGVEVGYKAHVWNVQPVQDPSVRRLYGWKNKQRLVAFLREGCKYRSGLRNESPLPMYRLVSESMFLAGQRGYGRLGADFWPVVTGGGGNLSSIMSRYPETNWGQLNISAGVSSVLAPGPDGVVSTVRFENLCDSLIEAEARYVVEKSLTSGTIDKDKATRMQALLDERARWLTAVNREGDRLEWFSCGEWALLTEQLYAAAGEVSTK